MWQLHKTFSVIALICLVQMTFVFPGFLGDLWKVKASVQCPIGSEQNALRCQPCRPGSHFSNGHYLQCSPGTFSRNISSFKCIQCSVGEYQPLPGQTTCFNCPDHAECHSDSFLCDPGYTIDMNKTQCIQCAQGFEKLFTGNQSCTPCPGGVCNGRKLKE